MKSKISTGCILLLSALVLTACTSSNAIRTSSNTAIIQTSAAPICGGVGAARVAQQQAAIETIKAGYDRYVIMDAASASNVRIVQTPGSYQTIGTIGGGFINTSTTYRPGPAFAAGTHDQSFAIRMFRDNEPGAAQAVSAREILGEDWQALVQSGRVNTCT